MMMIVMMMVVRFLPINHALNGAKLFHVAWYGNRSFLIEPIFFFSFFQQLHEQWVFEVYHRDHKPLLFLPLSHQYSQVPFWDVLHILLLMVVVMKMKVRDVYMKAHVVVLVIILMISNKPHNNNIFKYLKNQESQRVKIKIKIKNYQTLVFFLARSSGFGLLEINS